VGRERQQVDSHLLDVQGQLARSLDGVGVEDDALLAGNSRYRFYGLDGADSLLACITEMMMVSGLTARRTSSGSTSPSGVTGT